MTQAFGADKKRGVGRLVTQQSTGESGCDMMRKKERSFTVNKIEGESIRKGGETVPEKERGNGEWHVRERLRPLGKRRGEERSRERGFKIGCPGRGERGYMDRVHSGRRSEERVVSKKGKKPSNPEKRSLSRTWGSGRKTSNRGRNSLCAKKGSLSGNWQDKRSQANRKPFRQIGGNDSIGVEWGESPSDGKKSGGGSVY